MDYSDNMKFSEHQLATWAKPPSDSEKKRCVNAVALIKDAIRNDPVLSRKSIQIFGQGSHQNHTNVRLNSDVDVCVLLKRPFGQNYTFAKYKNSVEAALRRKFKSNNVTRGDKSIKVKSNSNRVSADVVPAFEYQQNTSSGIKFYSDTGAAVVNFPRQNEKNGNAKNARTSHRYKRMVRLLKKINYKLKTDGYIPSFLVECLVWNVPDSIFQKNSTYADELRGVLYHIYSRTKKGSAHVHLSNEWGEVNELLYLFKGHRKWTKGNAADFAFKAWNYVGFS